MGKVKEEENSNSLNKSVASMVDKRNVADVYNPATTPLGQDIEKGGEAVAGGIKKAALGVGNVLKKADAVAGTVLDAIEAKDKAMFNAAKEYVTGTPESLKKADEKAASTGIYPSDIGRAWKTGEVVSPVQAPYQPKTSALPVFTQEQNAKADALYNKANPVVSPAEKATAEKNLAQGTLTPETPSVSSVSKEAADIREATRQKEFAEYQKNNPPQSYGMKDTGRYENVTYDKSGTPTITLYGEKPQPYKGLSPESQQLIKDMESEGLSPGRKAKVIQGIIASEKGESGAMERAKLGMGMNEYQQESLEIERQKMLQQAETAKAAGNRDEEKFFLDLADKFRTETKEKVIGEKGEERETTTRTIQPTGNPRIDKRLGAVRPIIAVDKQGNRIKQNPATGQWEPIAK